MTQKKQITNSQTEKEQIIFRKTAAETGGELLEMEAFYAPQGAYPPDHYHPAQDEHFRVLTGVLKVRLNGREYTFQAGQTIEIPRGTVHSMRNGGQTEASVLWQVRPALQTQAFYETLFGLAADGRTNAQGVPNLLQLAVLLWDYRAEFVLSRPALPVQKLLFGPLALLGKALGYRSRYEKYSGSDRHPQGWQKAEASIWINQSPEQVFRFIANYNNDTQWRRNISRMTQSPADRTEVGTVTYEELDFLGRHYTTTARITAFEPDKRLEWASVEATTPVSGWRMVEPEGNGTRFTQAVLADLRHSYGWFAPLMARLFRMQMNKDMANLKAILE